MGLTHLVDADSDSREYIPTADSPFYCFPNPPVPLVVSPVFPRCTGVCDFVPCGILRAPWPSEWSRERSAPSSVARVCRLTPLCTYFAQGQHYAVYLFFTTGGGGSVSLITTLCSQSQASSVPPVCAPCVSLARTSVNIHTVLKAKNRLKTASEDARGAEISCRPVVMIRDSCLVTVLCLRGAAYPIGTGMGDGRLASVRRLAVAGRCQA